MTGKYELNKKWLIVFAAMSSFFAVSIALIRAGSVQSEEDLSVIGKTNAVFLPLINEGSPPLLCRFGINVIRSIDELDTSALRMGWYADYGSRVNPSHPGGATYAQTIRFSQDGDDYIASRTNLQILDVVAGNPGSDWLIGNEPDRRDFQDDLEPHVYAKAYHDMYYLIKTADPTARIFAGTIVQPTPVRLQYLDLVLSNYQTMYGESMPVDGWSVHNFILNEVSCEYDNTNCWGAEIPPGVDEPFGEILTIDDNDNVDLFKERIERFRQWMDDRGYNGLPVYLSEYGVLMPDWLGFDDARVNAFMSASFDYLLSAADVNLGDPNDGYRLVQKFSWYSTGASGDVYNGYLFDPESTAISAMGANYSNYVSLLPAKIDLYPSQIMTETVESIMSGTAVSLTVKATIANSGNLTSASSPAVVRFYDGDPDSGGVQIGFDQQVALSGCGENQTVGVLWSDISSGAHTIFVEVDSQNDVVETDENNNIGQLIITVGS